MLPLPLPHPRSNPWPWTAARSALVAVEARNRKRREVDGVVPIVDGEQADRVPRSESRSQTRAGASRKNRLRSRTRRTCRALPYSGSGTRAGYARAERVYTTTRSLHPQRFVRTLFVVLAPKTIKRSLLRAPVRRRRRSRLLFQRAMHALVPPVLFRMSGRNALRHNPQLHPPHRQARKPR